MQFTIVWSNKCNLSCDYCCVYDSLNKGSILSVEDAIKFFEWQLPLYSTEDVHIVEFFGGEPTLHMDEIRALMNHLESDFSDYKFSYRIYTNCIFNKTIRAYEDVWSRFDDIICSIDGMYEDNLLRTKSRKAYDTSIANYKHLRETYGVVAGVAFVLHPGSDVRKTFNYFKEMGCRYFHFEIASLWNDDKDNGVTVEYLIETFRTVHDLVLRHNSVNPDNYMLFSVPREFLSSEKFFTGPNKISCLDSMRSLSPTGNVYFCRDLAVSEFHLAPKSTNTDENVFFRQAKDDILPFNIKDLQLDKASNNFKDKARSYDLMTSCPVKSFEFQHLVKKTPDWILDEDFQHIVAAPMFHLMTATFSLHLKDRINDEVYLDLYNRKVETYGLVLERYEELHLQNKQIS